MSTYQKYIDARQAWLEAEKTYMEAKSHAEHAKAVRTTAWDKLSTMATELNDADRARVVSELSKAHKVETG